MNRFGVLRRSHAVAATLTSALLFATVAVANAAACLPDNYLYSVSSANEDVFSIDPQTITAGAMKVTNLGTTSFASAASARDPINGNVYYISEVTATPQLNFFNPATKTNGTAENITGLNAVDTSNGAVFVRATFASDGTLFAGTNGALLADGNAVINRITLAGVATQIQISGFPAGPGDMAFVPTANALQYYAIVAVGNSYNLYLITLTGGTTPGTVTAGSAALVGSTGVAKAVLLYGLAYGNNGTLYAGDEATTNIYSLNTTSGAATIAGTAAITGGLNDLGTLPVPQSVDLSVVKTADNTKYTPGSTVTYTLTVSSAASSTCTLPGVTLTDTLPTNVALTNVTYTAPTGAAYNATTDQLTGLTLAPGTSAALKVTGVVPTTAAAGTSFSNSANVTFPTTTSPNGVADPTLANNTSSISATVQGVSGLTIAKTAPGTAPAGGLIAYSIDVKNAGPSIGDGSVVSDPIPAGLTYVAGTAKCTVVAGTGTACAAPTVATAGTPAVTTISDTVTTLPANGEVLITFNVTAATVSATAYKNIATITPPANTTDSNATTSEADTTVSAFTSAFAKTVTDITAGGTAATLDNAKPGDVLQYSLTFTNLTNTAISALSLSDVTPANTTYVTGSVLCGTPPTTTPATTCTPTATANTPAAGQTTVTWKLAGNTLAPNAAITVTFQVKVQ